MNATSLLMIKLVCYLNGFFTMLPLIMKLVHHITIDDKILCHFTIGKTGMLSYY